MDPFSWILIWWMGKTPIKTVYVNLVLGLFVKRKRINEKSYSKDGKYCLRLVQSCIIFSMNRHSCLRMRGLSICGENCVKLYLIHINCIMLVKWMLFDVFFSCIWSLLSSLDFKIRRIACKFFCYVSYQSILSLYCC